MTQAHKAAVSLAALAVIIVAAGLFLPTTRAASTPAWQIIGNYGGYPSPASCTQSGNPMYPGYNSDQHCYWSPVPIALSAESISNSVYSYVADVCTSRYNNGCLSSRTLQYSPAGSPIYITTASPAIQLDWSCLPAQNVNWFFFQSQTGNYDGSQNYNGVWANYPLIFSSTAVLTRSDGKTLNTGGAMQGSITDSPDSNYTYTLTCGSYATTLTVQIVPSFSAPLTLSLSSNAQSVPPNTSATLNYSIQNLRSGGTCSITGPSGTTLLTRTMPVSNFSYTGADQTWTPPAGLTSALVKLWGGGGGQVSTLANSGGGGGYTIATLPSGPSSYTVIVGRGGSNASGAVYGGGGSRGSTSSDGGGGGRTAIRVAGGADDFVTAGGGGGAYQLGGGGGGIPNGGNSAVVGNAYSTGGTQTAGGTAVGITGATGSKFTGANNTGTHGGGGGGGYYGGGAAQYEGGGGGSARCDGSLSFCASVGTGQGAPASTNDPDYPGSPIGYGGTTGNGYAKFMGTFTGTVATPALSQNSTYTLSCTVGGVTAQSQATVQVQQVSAQPPTATIDAGAGSSVTKTIAVGDTASIVAAWTPGSGDSITATGINGQDQVTSVPCANVTPYNASCWLQPDLTKTYAFTPATTGTYNFYAAAKSTQYPTYVNYNSVQVIVVQPTLSLTGTPTVAVAPGTTHGLLSWTSQNIAANSCRLYSQSAGLLASGLGANVSNYDTGVISQAITYYVNCTKSTGGAIQSNTFTFSTLASQGTLGTGSSAFAASPSLVRKGGQTTLSWTTSGMTACGITAGDGTVLLGPNAATVDGAHSLLPTVTAATTYTLTCIDGVHAPVSQTASVRLVPGFQEI